MTKTIVSHPERCLGCMTCVVECSMSHTTAQTLAEALQRKKPPESRDLCGTGRRCRRADSVLSLRGRTLRVGLSHRCDSSRRGGWPGRAGDQTLLRLPPVSARLSLWRDRYVAPRDRRHQVRSMRRAPRCGTGAGVRGKLPDRCDQFRGCRRHEPAITLRVVDADQRREDADDHGN